MASGVYAGFGTRSRVLLTAGCVVIAGGSAVSFAVAPLVGFVTVFLSMLVGVALLGLSMLVRLHDLRYSMTSWLYRGWGLILPSAVLRGGVNLSPGGLFGNWRFVLPGETDRVLRVRREGRDFVLYDGDVVVPVGAPVRELVV